MHHSFLDPIPAAPEDVREEAFAAAPFLWKDLSLHPLSIGREGDFLIHCRRIGLPPLAAAMKSTETFLSHAIRILWFCAHEPESWLAFWMKREGSFLLDLVIREWADKHILPGEQDQVVGLALDIFDRAHVNHAARVSEDDADDVGEPRGPSDDRSTSSSSPGPFTAPSVPTPSNTTSRKRKAGRSSTATASAAARRSSGLKSPRKTKRNSTHSGRSGGE